MARRKRRRSRRNKKWIQKAIKRPGRVRHYVARVYGKKAFVGGDTKRGKIKLKYLKRARTRAERSRNRSLTSAIRLAMKLRKMGKKKKKK